LTSHAIFNRHAYVEQVDQIIFCKFSSFSIHDVASQGTFLTPHALRSNTCNNCFDTNLTKVGFGNGGHRFATIIPFVLGFGTNVTSNILIIMPMPYHGISQDANVHFNMVLMSTTSFRS
jgi:hypothetical protein